MLAVRLLGQFDVRRDGAPVAVPARAAQSLLAYLLLTAGTMHRREKLAGLLWADTTEENARKNLRHELWRLRQALETKTPRKNVVSYLLVDEIAIGFNAASDYWLDVAAMQKALAKSVTADELIETVSLYQGELLPGFYDDWVVLERERVRGVYEQKMARLLDLLVEAKRWEEVLEWGERWIALGQTPEPAYRALMLTYSAKGDRAKVALTFQRCVTALRDDLGVEPSPATQALFEQLSSGERPVSPPQQSVPATQPQSTASPERTTNLPVPLTSFIGREKELKEIAKLLSAWRLLTLTGPGGVGKTRTAIQTANDSIDQFRNGVWWVDLAPLRDEARVPQTVAEVLGVPELAGQPLIETLKIFLRDKRCLLVLDNCEHLITACAQLADDLLSHCANLRILATSREALGIAGERVYQMPTLSLPESRHPTFADLLIEYESIRLFVERASAVKSDFTLNERNAAAVLAICRRLDGIPLALELAAARVKLLTVEHIAERLNDRFNLLTQGSRTALPRQQTLRAAIDWSYDQLLEEARVLFQRLSVFAGGFTLEAAEGICSEAPLTPPTLLDVLTRLVDRSLVNVERQGDDTRFRMLETIREYACEKLDAAGETARLSQRHRDFFIAFAEQAEPQLKGAAQFEWLDRLEVEHDNWRAAWDCAIESDAELALRLASALLDFWWMRGNPGEGREWLAKLLPRTESWGQMARRARALSIAGQLAYLQRDFASARALLVQSLAMARTAGDEKEMAIALLWLARTAARQRDDPAAQAYSQECLAIYERLQDGWGMAMAISQSATMAVAQGQYAVAEERYLQSVAKFQALGDRFRMGFPLNGLGELARLLGDYERAGKFYQQHIELLRAQGSRGALLIPSVNMAWVSLHQGEYRQAQTLFEEGVKLSKEFGNQTTILSCLAGFASIRAMTGKTAQAARLFGAVEALLEGIRMARRMDPADQKEFDHYVRAARAQLDEAAFAQAWKEGRAMTLDQAVVYALEGKPSD